MTPHHLFLEFPWQPKVSLVMVQVEGMVGKINQYEPFFTEVPEEFEQQSEPCVRAADEGTVAPSFCYQREQRQGSWLMYSGQQSSSRFLLSPAVPRPAMTK
ncbi:unnamed protein product [Gadus morhua 'NCC']